MTKFILVNDYGDFDKIKAYIKNNGKTNYYIAPKLMYELLSSLKYKCVVGLSMQDIKIREHDKIDLLTMPVYSKIFQEDAFKIEAIKDYYLKKVNHEIDYNSVIFGIDEDVPVFRYFLVEEMN